MSAPDWKAVLEKKKARLATMREGRIKREESKKTGLLINRLQPSVHLETEVDADDILKELGFTVNELIGQNGCEITKSTGAVPISKSVNEKPVKSLTISKLIEFSIQPKEPVTYTKITQTFTDNSFDSPSIGFDTWLATTPRGFYGSPKGGVQLEWDEVGVEFHALEGDCMPSDITQIIKVNKTDILKETLPDYPALELSDTGKLEIINSEKFQNFFFRATKLIERALDEEADIFIDYSGEDREESDSKDRQLLKVHRDFVDDVWSRGRPVTCLDWSAVFPELLLAAYHQRESSIQDPEGVCLIWNMKYKKTSPEYIFNFQSAITSATLTEFHPSLVIGGTYSGQIVLWDIRSNRRSPVQRTSLSTLAHSEPVQAVVVTGSQNAHSLVSISSEGRLCTWSLDMLAQPQQSLELTHRQTKTLAPTSLAFLHDNWNNFLIGTEDGGVYAGSLLGNKAGITDVYEGHQAPVSSIAVPKLTPPAEMQPLFLSTSFDCSLKMWRKREMTPIYSFEDRTDYILDCDWSPLHPAVFASVDLNGHLDIWNFNSDQEIPTATILAEPNGSLNKCKFHIKGLNLAVGTTSGRIRLFDLHEKLTQPGADEWRNLAQVINGMSQSLSDHRVSDYLSAAHFSLNAGLLR